MPGFHIASSQIEYIHCSLIISSIFSWSHTGENPWYPKDILWYPELDALMGYEKIYKSVASIMRYPKYVTKYNYIFRIWTEILLKNNPVGYVRYPQKLTKIQCGILSNAV